MARITRPFRVTVQRQCNLRTDVSEYPSCPLLPAQTTKAAVTVLAQSADCADWPDSAPVLTRRRAVESLLLHSFARFAAWDPRRQSSLPNCKFCGGAQATTLIWQCFPSVDRAIARWYSECFATDRARKEAWSVKGRFVAS
jgi:hypothetical protein